jgi:hypothetical protein
MEKKGTVYCLDDKKVTKSGFSCANCKDGKSIGQNNREQLQ